MVDDEQIQDTGKLDLARLLHVSENELRAQQTEDKMIDAIHSAYEATPEEFSEYQEFFVDREKLKTFLTQAATAQSIISLQDQQIKELQKQLLELRQLYLEAKNNQGGRNN